MSALTLSDQALDTLLTETRAWGARPAETGAFLLSVPAAADRLVVIALAGSAGIRRERDLFLISGAALERLFSWAGERSLTVRAQIHSHRGHAFLSPTDLRGGFNVEGFTTAVIPRYADPPADPTAWGWWRYGVGGWRICAGPKPVRASAEVVVFDARGIRAA